MSRSRIAIRDMCLVLGLAASPAAAQQAGPPASQHGAVSQTVNRTRITVEYDRPSARGRTLFGENGIVVSDALWTPGANRATYVEFDTDVTVAGHPVPSGRYSLWTVPRSGPWTVILNRLWDTHHAIYPGEAEDVLRIEVETATGDLMETLAFYFPVVGPYSTALHMHWGTTVLPIHIMVPGESGPS